MDRGVCRSCGADVVWVVTEKGRRMPVDSEPSGDGPVVWDPDGGEPAVVRPVRPVGQGALFEVAEPEVVAVGEVRWTPHHATCPDGPAWRQREKERRHGHG